MNYKIIDNAVVETQTEGKIYESNDIEKLREVKRRLNMGGGFDGFSPGFFFEKVKVSSE